jgi:DNA polymerase IV
VAGLKDIGAVFTRLCESVAGALARKGYAGCAIGIKLRFDDFRAVTRDTTFDEPTADAHAIRRIAGLTLKRAGLSRRIRLPGVRVGKLSRLES